MRPARWLVVTGLPATGKSTLARVLAVRYRLPVIAKDRIKESLLDLLPPGDDAASRRLSDASFAVLFRLAADLAQARVDAILEGNFRPGEHERELPATSRAVVVAQVLCRVPEPIRLERLAARAGDPARHPGHRDAAQAAAGSRSGDDFLALPGARLVYDGSPASGHGLHAALDPLFRDDPRETQA
jgi:predicted kinase